MSVDLLLAYARTGMAHKQAPTLEEVQSLVRTLATSPLLPTPVTEDEIDQVIKQVECEFLVNLGPARYLKAKDHKPWLKAKSHEIDFRYWRRYRNHLIQSGFGPNVVNALGEVTDNLLDLAGDPTVPGEWTRRGLVVGHVQSGKTANYVGLINKAADAGYKLIILIAGIHSNLRSQTQERIDQGFVGRDSDQLLLRQTNANFLGVGALDRSFSAVAYTSRAHDFLKVRADGLGISINNLSQPAIFVIKKHKSILTNLIEWLKGTSATGDRLTMPMLVIDDEADNASVNIAADPDRPNAINSLIRTLLSISTKNTYVGYTATPFANIFIDPDTTAELFGDDLFPRDFIVGLDAPSNYVGAREFFLADDRDPILTIELEDTDSWLPITHKIDTQIDDLHESLLQAINCFLLSKAIRILRGQGAKHHSMLVNVSRFTGVQGRVCSRIQEHLTRLKDAIENRHGLSVETALKDPLMRSLHDTCEEVYGDVGEDWPQIQKALHQAAAGVVVVEVNAHSGPGALDYRSHAETGLNVIAVGGNSLSRGFTLEGLTVSYFLRNTQMYDTLLQMGRWFGYRDGYADLCRLYIRPEALAWYAYITEAADELRSEIRRMESLKLTPKDFGLAVRAHPDSLLVTARNKMRTAKEIVREVGLANRLVESTVILGANGAVSANWDRMEGFVVRLLALRAPVPVSASKGLQSQLFREVAPEVALDFISRFLVHPGNLEMQTEPLSEYIRRRQFPNWDVVVVSSSLASAKDHRIESVKIGLQERFATPLGGGRSGLQISGQGRRVASRGLEAVGLSETEHGAAIESWSKEYEAGNAGKNIADHFYRAARSRPLLMLHFLDVGIRNGESTERRERHAAYGISFPPLRRGETEQRVTYKANVVAYRELFGQMDADGDDDDAFDE